MTILVAVTAALALHASPPPASAASDVRTISGLPVIGVVAGSKPPRYVRLRLDVTAYGVPGHGEIVVDRTLGRFVRRFDAGPVSEREGWDGAHPWRADPTGMARIEGNVDERGAIRAWARLLAPAPGDAPCDCGSRAPDIATDPVRGRVTSVALHVGSDTQHVGFADYRRAGTIVVPFGIENTSENGTWKARVRAVETPQALAPNTFSPPPEPHDATLSGVASVPLIAGLPVPVIEESLDHEPALRCLLDTGGQNAITPGAAQRMGLNVVGAGTVSGAGAGLANVRYASVRSVRIGTAELRDQPFVVLDFGAGAPFDCIAGYELFARFAARIDFANDSLQLAADARAFPGGGISVPMTFADRQPQIDGTLDGFPGAVTIDTGSVIGAEVNAPFARAHDLAAHYHAVPVGAPIRGVGGPVRVSL
ncbi:MAG TPA: aspartyl protease family protein, partial [Xanthomonadales bacterium]|nr:aspartyl protease family protein [Xanthomonadales bacterium]